ncbi:MAG: hypothetical protein RBT63_03710, partial [Bdellovibrionales bacterium]|nr:hypothetical protein [Bdellovibrionales bacterium]
MRGNIRENVRKLLWLYARDSAHHSANEVARKTDSSDISRLVLIAVCTMLLFAAAPSQAQSSKAKFDVSDDLYTDFFKEPDLKEKALEESSEGASSWLRSERTQFRYRLRSGFDSFANEYEQSQYFGLRLGGDFRMQLMEPLVFRLKATAGLSSGYAQSRFGDSVGASGIYLNEALLRYQAWETSYSRFNIEGGAVSQEALNATLLVDQQPFPGVRQSLWLWLDGEGQKDSKYLLRIWAQQTIPTSKTLSTKAVETELMPTFMSETVELAVYPTKPLYISAAVTHYAFNDLPSSVALESEIYGNTTDEIGPSTSRFRYRFDGVMASGQLAVKFAPRSSVFL